MLLKMSACSEKYVTNRMIAKKLKGYLWKIVVLSVLATIVINYYSNSTGEKSELRNYPKSQKFYVNTDQCQMPRVDPFGPELKAIFKPEKYRKCSNEEPFVSKFYNSTHRHYTLIVNEKYAKYVQCCYQKIMRKPVGKYPDIRYTLFPCENFHQNFVVPHDVDAMFVTCTRKNNTNRILQKDIFYFLQYRNESSEFNSNDRRKKPNVFLIAIDSLSRFNFRRNMPKTAEFLMKNDWFELEGYNKVGENTFPNIMALMVGIDETLTYKECDPKTTGGLDKCHYIWQDFKKNGYETAYGEDWGHFASFNLAKKGFSNQPTDYYLHPSIVAAEDHNKNPYLNCFGHHHLPEYIFEFALEFAKRHRKKPGFGLFWLNRFSHESFSGASSMDLKVLEYMNEFQRNEVFETSIVLFFSDHGTRWGPLMKLSSGLLEERLPMFFISLPKWFRQNHPDYVRALQINANRLTTPYDINQTLQHILNLITNESGKEETIKPARGCANAQSIFHEIPENRNCKDACIPEYWCTCTPYERISGQQPEVLFITDSIIDEINNYLRINNFTSVCSLLRRDSVQEALMRMATSDVISRTKTLRVQFTAKPKEPCFEANALYDVDEMKVKILINDVIRLDSYAPTSRCMDNEWAKKFCICK